MKTGFLGEVKKDILHLKKKKKRKQLLFREGPRYQVVQVRERGLVKSN